MISLIIATRNSHKVQEFKTILGKQFRYFTLDHFAGAPLAKEDGTTFDQNAVKKSVNIARWLLKNPKFQLPLLPDSVETTIDPVFAVADDSGLEVDVLDGEPGVLSARYASIGSTFTGNAPDSANNQKLLEKLKGMPETKRGARFRCVISISPVEIADELRGSMDLIGDVLTKRSETFSGSCEGQIAFGASGKGGFGYDPLFVPAGHTKSFAELGESVKNKMSHRAEALRKLKEWFKSKN